MTDGYLRFPHVHDDLVTFVAEDDVWLAPLDGGRAWRVTADGVPAANPRFSPDGELLAWASRLNGAPEVHVVPVAGGLGKRLTYWGDPKATVLGWTPEGDVLALSAVGEQSLRHTWARAVPVDGAPATRLPYGPVSGVAVAADGAVVLSSAANAEPAWWKRYRGGTAGKLWVDTTGDGEFDRVLPELRSSLVRPMWVDGRIVFISDHEGFGNVYSCTPDGSDVRRHSSHEDFFARHASTDGSRVVYQSGGSLWLLDGLDAEPRELDVRLTGPRPFRQPTPVPTAKHLGAAVPDRTGRASAVEVRGTVHWLTHRDGPVRALAAEPGVRGRLPRPLGDDRVVWVTDADGEDALEISPVAGRAAGVTPRRLASGQLGRVLDLAVSPDGSTIAVTTHDRRLLLVDVDGGGLRELAAGGEGDPDDAVFSPDSEWVAWSQPGAWPLRQIRLARVDDLSTVDVTPLRFVDYSPAFTSDGKHIAFLSKRSFDPIYDEHVFDMSFANGGRPYLVPLGATTRSPFGPQLDGRPYTPDSDDEQDGKKKDDRAVTVTVDIEGLSARVVAFPVPTGRYYGLSAAEGGLLWLRYPVNGVLDDDGASGVDAQPNSLEFFDLEKRSAEELVDDLDWYSVSGDGKRIVVRDSGGLRVLPANRKAKSNGDAGDDRIEVDLARVRVVIDPGAEWRQAFRENGRLMRDHYWRADMSGIDWAGVLDRYEPLVERLGSHDDFVDMLWEVQAELGASHAYVMPPARSNAAARRMGMLGADIARDEAGVWRVERVLPGESSVPDARSPLAAPGVGVREGDALIAVNGRVVDAESGPGPLLAGTADTAIELTVGPRDGGESRRVVVVPLASEEALRYQAWVADRRSYVDRVGEGRIGYVHVPDMMGAGWAELHRDLRVETAREAVVADVRENRGGHLSQLVVEKLARRVVGWQVGRDGFHPRSYPLHAPRGPVVVVANEFSGSDGDIVNAAAKAMGVGPVVGVRTWGGTVGIDSRYRLVDGTLVTQPRYATWIKGVEWGMENHGVDPDVEVVMAPQDWVNDRDPQLDTAIRMALEALEETPAVTLPALPELS
ncbi:S41 family peptidase [Allokutzneria sp. NRRL B-24872]|uniref:S41 family peptidase n=1 Tax=Allokutzneria sp. NRRL B-24872 TaxID=1137961 RepID=UPI000A37E6AE|nr:S41 family peptidase [Allokutzneria sp. NRRL B-24872]